MKKAGIQRNLAKWKSAGKKRRRKGFGVGGGGGVVLTPWLKFENLWGDFEKKVSKKKGENGEKEKKSGKRGLTGNSQKGQKP